MICFAQSRDLMCSSDVPILRRPLAMISSPGPATVGSTHALRGCVDGTRPLTSHQTPTPPSRPNSEELAVPRALLGAATPRMRSHRGHRSAKDESSAARAARRSQASSSRPALITWRFYWTFRMPPPAPGRRAEISAFVGEGTANHLGLAAKTRPRHRGEPRV